MLRLSYGMEARYPAQEALGLIGLADELGFHGCYLADDPSGRDPWLISAAAARQTTSIRLGFSATHVYLREPTLIAQALATLDELSDGRAEAVVSYGDPGILDAYHVEWRGARPLARVREAVQVMRTFLDEGEINHQGDFFHYSGVTTGARPIQEHVPLLIGAIGGPKSFQLAGEAADGVHCVGASRTNSRYVVEHVARGAEQAGRDAGALDIAAACITAVAEDADAARAAARPVVTGWASSFPASLIERHGLDPEEVGAIVAAVQRGEYARAIDLTTPQITAALALTGTPEECADRIRNDMLDGGIEHVVLALADAAVVEAYAGEVPAGLPDAAGQLRLIHERLMPALA
jgi:5,10-methylenetetrahydromethanopterin reductase